MVRAVLEIYPTANYRLASETERSDQMLALSRVLMGLQNPIQLVSQAREVDWEADWSHRPDIRRRWFAVVTADDNDAIVWRGRTLKAWLDSIGLRCSEPKLVDDETTYEHVKPKMVMASDGYWTSTLVVRRWPREVAPGWLGQALALDLPVDVGIHIAPSDPQKFARFLRKQQSWQTEANAVKPDAANELGRSDAERIRRNLIAGTDRPCRVAIAITVRASSPEQLKRRVQTVRQECGLALAEVREATFEHDRGLIATSLDGRCDLQGVWRTLDCTSVASTWMFQPTTVHHKNGADLGVSGGMLVKLDPFDETLESFGGIILAKVGMGKSFLLKLLAWRLAGVEVLVVEQRNPPEFRSVPGVTVLSLAELPVAERAARLREFITNLWETAKRDPKPRLLILDELWSLLREPELAGLIEEIARIGRHYWLSLWIATQQVRELIQSGRAVLDNAAIRIYLKQHDRDLDDLCEAVGLPAPARQYLRSAGRGQALLDVSGMLVPVDVQATPEEHRAVTTDPRELSRLAA